MNVFEDLVVELQEENLLETTVMDPDQSLSAEMGDLDITDMPNRSYDLPASIDSELAAVVVSGNDEPHVDDAPAEQSPTPSKPKNGREFYKKRAIGEVSSLQMVEHVLTGVEREYMKVVPAVFDDFNAKKTLNTFLQVAENENSEEHAEAEFALMQETESWCSALAARDRNVPVYSIRQYCENSRPALSSQALLALARFYRNLPYSENVRSKFDFVITRLFSRPAEHDKRACLFNREETLGHINTLYSEWSSIALYTADDDESNVLLTALSFDDLALEAENASNFDQLIASDFFGRLRLFKESISELFFAPNVTAAAIECNIRIGNAYVNLIDLEHQKMDAESIQSKYGDLNDHTVSDAAGRTLDLVELLRQKPEPVKNNDGEPDEYDVQYGDEPVAAAKPKEKAKPAKERSQFFGNFVENARNVNRWFLALAVLLIAASVGLYVWANYFVSESVTTAGVKVVEVENTTLKPYLKTARISGETYYGLLQPVWDNMTKDKRQEVLQKIYQSARENGCTQVNLIGKDGKIAAYASVNRLDVNMP